MTISDSLNLSYQKLNNLESYQYIAQRLLAEILSKPISYLFAHPDSDISEEQSVEFIELVDRASSGEPLAYILGHADFYDLRFQVNSHVLIPRPETENLIELALRHFQDLRFKIQDSIIVDVGTGSGCIALTLAKHLPESRIYAIDVSPEALEVARTNARLLDIPNVTFSEGSLLEPLKGVVEPGSVEVIVANLPYISDAEFDQLPQDVRGFEPALALKSGASPDQLNHQLAAQVPHYLRPDGLFAYETTNGRIVTPK